MGYDTAVIGGTMALDSFVRDFRLDEVNQHTRDGIQANIVSTFQVRLKDIFLYHSVADQA